MDHPQIEPGNQQCRDEKDDCPQKNMQGVTNRRFMHLCRGHTGDDQQDIPVYLRRISGLEEATTEQINNSYIVLADSENHKNYKTNLGNIIRSLKQDSTDKVQALKTIIEEDISVENLIKM